MDAIKKIIRDEMMRIFPFDMQKDRLEKLIKEKILDVELDDDKLFESYMIWVDCETDEIYKTIIEEDEND